MRKNAKTKAGDSLANEIEEVATAAVEGAMPEETADDGSAKPAPQASAAKPSAQMELTHRGLRPAVKVTNDGAKPVALADGSDLGAGESRVMEMPEFSANQHSIRGAKVSVEQSNIPYDWKPKPGQMGG